ncbi:MAG: TIGR03621 family F420-dependent LLM class oxidoreductase [Pseudonocardia sp.]|nr:TIGR03621 family F420-dependent LLM class oxidoreductase [Pseudonocardia sp.]
MAALEFGINMLGVGSQTEFTSLVSRAETLGFDVFAAPDHLGAMAPFSALVAAGATSSRLRLRSYVLNVGFWNPALLARAVASADLLSGGRVELGLGAGHMRSKHRDAGLAWPPHPQRVQALADTLGEVRRRLADPDHQPQPVQNPVPVMVGAMSDSAFDIAARHADIVGLAGLRQVPGTEPGTFTVVSAAETDEQVAPMRERADGREHRTDLLLQAVVIGDDPERCAAAVAAQAPDRLTIDQLLDTPFVLIAEDAAAAAAELERRRHRYGLTSITTHQPHLEALGQVLAAHHSLTD